MDAHGAAVLLTVLGGVLPAAGTGWGLALAWRRSLQLTIWERRVDELNRDQQARVNRKEPGEDLAVILRREGIPATTWGDLTKTRIWVEQSIVGETLRSLRGPAILVGLGIACGTIGSVVALYLVP